MLFAYIQTNGHLVRLDDPMRLAEALWIDLYRPLPEQIEQVTGLGVDVPTLADMEEIEISNRLYREDDLEVMTVVLPGLSVNKSPSAGPVTFMLSPTRLITVRHHAPRPFETFPERANRAALGCTTPERVFLGLVEEIVGRLADLLEGIGRSVDEISASVFPSETPAGPEDLQAALHRAGHESELLSRIRLGLLTVERMLSYFGQTIDGRVDAHALKQLVKGEMRDIQALAVHADFLTQRIAMASDATLGMINLQQNNTVRTLSVVAALFLPPTLIASAYGMNFHNMPELDKPWGYPAALGLMVASAVVTWLYFKWRRWL